MLRTPNRTMPIKFCDLQNEAYAEEEPLSLTNKDKLYGSFETKIRRVSNSSSSPVHLEAIAKTERDDTKSESASERSFEVDDEVLDLSINKNKSTNAAKKAPVAEEPDSPSPNTTDADRISDEERRKLEAHYDLSNWILNAVRQTQLNNFLYSQMKLPQSIPAV